MTSIAAVIVTYHTGPALAACVDSLLAQSLLDTLVIVDNGNDEATRVMLSRLATERSQVRLLTPGRNLGFAAACNLGAAQVSTDLVALVNPDVILPADALERMAEASLRHPQAWVLSGRLVNMDGSEQLGSRRVVLTPWRMVSETLRLHRLFPNHPHFQSLHLNGAYSSDEPTAVATVSGAFMVIPRHRWLELGGMDANLFLHFDDADLCIRVLKAGGLVLHCGGVEVRHYRGTSDVPRIFVEWHKSRSASIYFAKHFNTAFPGWALRLVDAMVWARFAAIVLRNAPEALAWAWRRWKNGARKC